MMQSKTVFVALVAHLFMAQSALANIEFVRGDTRSVPKTPDFLATGDFNEDGISDLVVSSLASDKLSLLLGGADGSFRSETAIHPSAVRKPRIVATGDVNGDGHDDVVMADQRARSIFIFYGDGRGSFPNMDEVELPREANREAQAFGLAIADFDVAAGNGNDIVVSDRGGDQAVVLINNGELFPVFDPITFPVDNNPEDVVAADFNQDGNADFAVMNTGGPAGRQVTVYLFDRIVVGKPLFRLAGNFLAGRDPSDLTVADFDEDFVPDLAVLNKPAGRESVEVIFLLSRVNEQRVFSLEPRTPLEIDCPFGNPTCRGDALAAGDLNNDGITDLIVAINRPDSYLRDVSFLRGEGAGFYLTDQVFTLDQGSVKDIVTGQFTSPDTFLEAMVSTRRGASINVFLNVSGRELAEPCSDDTDCKSGFCRDGVCCNEDCGEGETCNAPGFEGICIAFTPTPTRTQAPGTPGPPGGPCVEDADCEPGLFCVNGVCCLFEQCPAGEFCLGTGDDVPGFEDDFFIGRCVSGTRPPTRIPSPTPTAVPPTIITKRGGGGCSTGGGVPSNGAKSLVLIALLPAVLWVRKRRQHARAEARTPAN